MFSLDVLGVLHVGHLSLVSPDGSDGDSWDTDKEPDGSVFLIL